MTDSTFAARLKALRTAAGLTQAQLAERAGVALVTVRRYEQGVLSAPAYATLTRLADALGVKLDAFR